MIFGVIFYPLSLSTKSDSFLQKNFFQKNSSKKIPPNKSSIQILQKIPKIIQHISKQFLKKDNLKISNSLHRT